ncbi:MAG: 2-oxo acid dehydrogenase subunit E2 [Planctomycetales bacterium]|jgi:pyruvate dehydrogenase E2 component (dihydrolipoamide acetyltransferase)
MAEFKIPDVGEGISEVDLAALSVSVGDVIEAGMVVAEVETEKAATDIDCPIGGKVVKIHANPGDTLAVGAVLLTIEAAASAAPAKEAPAAPAAAEPAAAPTAQAAAPVAATPAPATVTSAAPADDRAPAPAGPATRRLARQLGVDLHGVSGSAAGGRITQEDVKSHVKQIMDGGGAASGGGGYAPPPLPDFTKWGPVDREPMNKISRSAAANLSMCWNVIPHVTQHDLIDITDLEAARRRYSDKAKKTGAPKVTMTAIAMKASVVCLKEFPKFNSSLDPQTNEIVYRKYFNIGCAVDTPNGLLVPVIKDCDQKSVAEIGAELSDVAGRARDRKVSMDEMQGACFTITNLGGIGGTAFTPIVNYPEVAILGMSRGRKELQIIDGEIEERFMLPLSMSYDHRVVNGADAARFVVRLGQLLGDAFNLAATI